ncbi:MAG: hypothetical protein V1857_02185 [archaeon]
MSQRKRHRESRSIFKQLMSAVLGWLASTSGLDHETITKAMTMMDTFRPEPYERLSGSLVFYCF